MNYSVLHPIVKMISSVCMTVYALVIFDIENSTNNNIWVIQYHSLRHAWYFTCDKFCCFQVVWGFLFPMFCHRVMSLCILHVHTWHLEKTSFSRAWKCGKCHLDYFFSHKIFKDLILTDFYLTSGHVRSWWFEFLRIKIGCVLFIPEQLNCTRCF